MKKKIIIIALLSIIIISALTFSIIWYLNSNTKKIFGYDIELAFPNLTFINPVGIYSPNDGSNRLFILEQGGRIFSFNNNYTVQQKNLFLDISDLIITGGERGLLGLAFHPNFSQNGYFYLDYTDTNGDTVVSRFQVNSGNKNFANKSSEYILLNVEQPYSNHNGGQIAFGPDGYLYIALGDGGSAGDPLGNGQNRNTLLGSILRIDVDSATPYAIPSDNPFFGNLNGYREEIYAFGLRNPWRFSFDPITGNLWAGDVGQSAWEEIDIIESGNNYGWSAMEGNHPYSPGINVTKVEPPIYEYGHNIGHSITGGFVYRGFKLPELYGKYIYGDYEYGQVWALKYDGLNPSNNSILVDTTLEITSFGLDANYEIFFCAFNGKIYTIKKI
ncbi:MAG: PQQ-dependent sugar dehydrogenase [Promethearchaeota archaeon]